MATVNLSWYNRKQLVDALIKQRFDEEEKRLENSSNILGMEAYEQAYSKEIRDLMEALPEGFLPRKSYIRFTSNYSLDEKLHLFHTVLVSARDIDYHAWKTKDFGPLGLRIDNHINRMRDFEKRKHEAYNEADNFIKNYRTVSALLKVWPEVKPITDKLFADQEKSNTRATSIALKTDDLNAKFGLPKGDADVATQAG